MRGEWERTRRSCDKTVVTIMVLLVVSFRRSRDNQPPAHLGLPYFREDR